MGTHLAHGRIQEERGREEREENSAEEAGAGGGRRGSSEVATPRPSTAMGRSWALPIVGSSLSISLSALEHLPAPMQAVHCPPQARPGQPVLDGLVSSEEEQLPLGSVLWWSFTRLL